MIKKQITVVLEVEDEPDFSFTPEAVLRAKSELLAEFLGCEVHDAERLLLDRVTDIGV
jgi:hypothetical protein